jgi:hypothetical protein
VIDRWPTLPVTLRQKIVNLVRRVAQ